MNTNQGEMLRTFVAINLPGSLREQLSSLIDQFRNRLKPGRTRVTWVRAESLHLTLKFLGSVESESVSSILKILEKAASGFQPFSMFFGDLGVFPNVNQPRVIWVGVQKGAEEVCQLQKRVDDGLSELGFDRERKGFSPHLTLGRIKALGSRGEVLRALKELNQPEIGEMQVTHISLMKSTLTPSGAIYSELGAVRFRNK